jgi:uncharacterized membrane protein YkvA (DUF1232 family)
MEAGVRQTARQTAKRTMDFLRRIWRGATRKERLVLVLALVLALVYLISPFDVLPEALLGPIGLTDDLAALGVLLSLVRRIRLRLPDAARQHR